jgi:hypothetical protein
VLGCQPVVDGHHHRVGADGVLAAGAVVGVEVAHHETAAVKENHHGLQGAIGMCCRPIDPDPDGARWALDIAVFHPKFWMQLPARQIP